jgi:lipid A biosynthesis lauroyl acyltransferase
MLGRLFYRILPYRRKISETNLRIAFPDLDDAARAHLLREHAKSVGRGIIETGMAWYLSEEKLRALSRFEADPASLALLRAPAVPVVLIGSHSTLMELGVRLLGLYVDAGGMYRPLNDPFYHHWIKHHRARAATELIHYKDMRHTLRFLQGGGNLWYALDQDMGPRVSVFAPFFGVDAASVNILPKLRARTGAHWIPVYMWREADNRYVVRVAPEIKPVAGESDTDVMRRVNTDYEREIRQHPEQYYWLHRRYKNRPDGSRYPYPEKRRKKP